MSHSLTKHSKSAKLLLQLIWSHKLLFILGVVSLILGSAINLTIPEVTRRAIDGIYGNLLLSQPSVVISWIIAIFTVQAVFFYFRSYFFYAIGQHSIYFLRNQIFSNLLNKPCVFFDSHKVADLNSRLVADTQVVQEVISMRLSVLLRYTLQALVGIVLMCLLSLRLASLLAITLPVVTILGFVLGRQLKNCSRHLQDLLGRVASIAEETLSNIKLVKSFARQTYMLAKFNTDNSQSLNIGLKRSRISAFFSSFVGLLMNIAIAAVLLYGITLTHSNHLTIGDLTAFMLYGAIVAVSFSFAIASFAEILQGLGALDRIAELLTSEYVHDELSITPTQSAGHIRFESVSFAYAQQPDKLILKNISLELRPLSSTALVGSSGSGKSTIAALLLGLYPVTSGKITFDGLNLNSLNLNWYNQKTAYVPQDPALFAMTIRENILFGYSEASDEEILAACRKARALEFIERLPDGFNTMCGERGHQLSGGERQRIAIARALIKKPLILVLDEPTSALDGLSEEAIRSTLDDLKNECTLVVIAHRLSTVRNVDQLIVIEDGSIVESGTPSSLGRESGAYKQLLAAQYAN